MEELSKLCVLLFVQPLLAWTMMVDVDSAHTHRSCKPHDVHSPFAYHAASTSM